MTKAQDVTPTTLPSAASLGAEERAALAQRWSEEALAWAKLGAPARGLAQEEACEAAGIHRRHCWSGLTPGMRLEVHFENMEVIRCTVVELIGQTGETQIGLLPHWQMFIAPGEFTAQTRISRLYRAVPEFQELAGQRGGPRPYTLIDDHEEIVLLRPEPTGLTPTSAQPAPRPT